MFFSTFLVSRDKPKRYSSQRQKPGNSMMDIPGQFNEASPEETRQYLEQFGKFVEISIKTVKCKQNDKIF